MKHITHASGGYDFVGSVDMADIEEGEMPVCFYRRKWGASRAVWDFVEPQPQPKSQSQDKMASP
jgi:hypothetical protein